MKEKETMQLPENAFRELKEGEEYKPLMSPDRQYSEVNAWSVTWGIIMAILFSAAALSPDRHHVVQPKHTVNIRVIFDVLNKRGFHEIQQGRCFACG